MSLTLRNQAAAILLLLASPAFGQDDALREAAAAYISSPSQQSMIDQLLSPENIVEQARASRPDLPEELIETIGSIASDELSKLRPDLENAMVEAAATTFTLEEIQAIDAFYRTPEGAAVLLKTQDFMRSATAEIAPKLRGAQESIAARAMQAIEENQ